MGLQPQLFTFQEYCQANEVDPRQEYIDWTVETETLETLRAKEPWRPFPTRLDFELAEVALDSHMNQRQIQQILSIVRQVIPGNADEYESFTIRNARDLANMWNKARDA